MKRILTIILLTLAICSCEASKILKTNQAVILAVGPFVDFSDGCTPETSMTVTNITMELYRETDEGSAPTRAVGVNPTASGGSNDMVHITSDVAGFYSIELTASNVNFLGRATLVFTDPDVCLPVFVPITVVSDQIFSSLIEDDDELQVHTAEITGDLISASVIASDAIGSSELAANSITSSEIADDSIDAGAIAADSIGASELAADAVGSSEIGTGAIDADSIAADAIGSSELGADAIGSSELAAGAITEIQSGLANTAMIARATGDVITEITGLNDITASDVWSNGTRTLTDPLAAEFDIVSASINGLEGSSAPSAATIADAVWDEAIAGHAGAGSTGAALSGASAPTANQVRDAILAASINQTTLEEALEWIYTWAVGSFVKSGNTVTYDDSLGNAVFSFDIYSTTRSHGE